MNGANESTPIPYLTAAMMKKISKKNTTYVVDGDDSFSHIFAQMDAYNHDGATETHVVPVEIGSAPPERCLISKEVLDWTAVRLNCGHAFNYDALFAEMVAHRGKHGNKYSNIYHMKMDSSTNENCKYSIICPYCRTITPHTLPMKDAEDGTPIIEKKGVNTPTKYAHSDFRCSHTVKVKKGENGPCLKKCPNIGIIFPIGVYCKVHRKILLKAEAKAKRAEEKAEAKAEEKAKRAEEKAEAKAKRAQERAQERAEEKAKAKANRAEEKAKKQEKQEKQEN